MKKRDDEIQEAPIEKAGSKVLKAGFLTLLGYGSYQTVVKPEPGVYNPQVISADSKGEAPAPTPQNSVNYLDYQTKMKPVDSTKKL